MEILILPIWLSFVFWSPNSHLQRKKDNTFSVCARNPIRLYLYCSYIFIKSRISTEGLQRVLHFLRKVSVGGPEGQFLWFFPRHRNGDGDSAGSGLARGALLCHWDSVLGRVSWEFLANTWISLPGAQLAFFEINQSSFKCFSRMFSSSQILWMLAVRIANAGWWVGFVIQCIQYIR